MGCSKFGIATILFLGSVTTCFGARRPCPTLSVLPGTVVTCDLPSDNSTVDCLSENSTIPRGTIARYKCERDQDYNISFLKCRCKGKWNGLRIFNDYMKKCNISDYSLQGPQELNLTSREIRQLSGVDDTSSNSNGQSSEFQGDATAYHNFYRKIHHSPALKLNSTLSQAAQKWADTEVDQPTIRTEDWANRWYSQNLYRITSSNMNATEAVRLAVAAWYQGAYRYNWENPSGQSAFTQVVWKSTSDLGIGVAQAGNRTVVVANYFPPGNVVVANPTITDKWAWFRENVFPPNSNSEDIQTATVTPMSSETTSFSTSTETLSTMTPTSA